MRRLLEYTGYLAGGLAAMALLAGGITAALAGGPLWIRVPLIAAGAVAAVYVARTGRQNPDDAQGGDDAELLPDAEEDAFDELVAAAVAALPDEIRERMSNVAIVVEDEPPDGAPYLGFYRGYPLTLRTGWYAGAAPDKISIYRGPLERLSGGDPKILADEVEHVVRHEVAHHFGISDARLIELDRY